MPTSTTHDDEFRTRRRRRRAFIQALLVLLAPFLLAMGLCVVRTEKSTTGVLDIPLPGICSIWYFTERSQQPFRHVILGCPGVDAIRLWPLPIQQPWAEDRFVQPWSPATPGPQKRMAYSASQVR